MLEMIAAHPFLSAAGPAAASALLAAAQLFSAPRRTVIFTPEAAPEALYLLLEGSVGLSMRGADGTRGLLEIIGPDECFLMPAVILGGTWPFGAGWSLPPSGVHAFSTTIASVGQAFTHSRQNLFSA